MAVETVIVIFKNSIIFRILLWCIFSFKKIKYHLFSQAALSTNLNGNGNKDTQESNSDDSVDGGGGLSSSSGNSEVDDDDAMEVEHNIN